LEEDREWERAAQHSNANTLYTTAYHSFSFLVSKESIIINGTDVMQYAGGFAHAAYCVTIQGPKLAASRAAAPPLVYEYVGGLVASHAPHFPSLLKLLS
jgi:hypothetical protein